MRFSGGNGSPEILPIGKIVSDFTCIDGSLRHEESGAVEQEQAVIESLHSFGRLRQGLPCHSRITDNSRCELTCAVDDEVVGVADLSVEIISDHGYQGKLLIGNSMLEVLFEMSEGE